VIGTQHYRDNMWLCGSWTTRRD